MALEKLCRYFYISHVRFRREISVYSLTLTGGNIDSSCSEWSYSFRSKINPLIPSRWPAVVMYENLLGFIINVHHSCLQKYYFGVNYGYNCEKTLVYKPQAID